MNVTLRRFLLKSIPYLLAIAGGGVMYWLTADKINNPDLRDLVNNIAASLLSIPLVFLLYDYSNFLISRQLARVQTDNTHDKIDNILINIIIIMRQILGMRGALTLSGLNKMTSLGTKEIASRIRIRQSHINALESYNRDLDDLLYRGSGVNVFSMMQLQSLTTLTRNISHLINLQKFRRSRHDTARYTENIIRFIADWVDADASISMHFQQLISGEYSNDGNDKNASVQSGSMIGMRGRAATGRSKKR